MRITSRNNDRADHLSRNTLQSVARTSYLSKKLEHDLEHPARRQLLPDIHELRRSLRTLEADLLDAEDTSIGEGC